MHKKWYNIQSSTKKKKASRTELKKTGGGDADFIPATPIEEKFNAVIGNTSLSRIPGGVDTAETATVQCRHQTKKKFLFLILMLQLIRMKTPNGNTKLLVHLLQVQASASLCPPKCRKPSFADVSEKGQERLEVKKKTIRLDVEKRLGIVDKRLDIEDRRFQIEEQRFSLGKQHRMSEHYPSLASGSAKYNYF